MEERQYQNNLFQEDENGGVVINKLLNVEMKEDATERVFIFTNNKELSNGLRFNCNYYDNEFSIIADKIEMDLPIITVYKDDEIIEQVSLEKYKKIGLYAELSQEDNFVMFKCVCSNEKDKEKVDISTVYPQYFEDINNFINEQIKSFNSILEKLYGEKIELVNLLESIAIISNEEEI